MTVETKFNEKLLEVRYNETFSRKGSWPPEAKVDGGFRRNQGIDIFYS
jgi:hypothetical protein